MKPRTLTSILIILICGFSGGWFVGSRRPVPVPVNKVSAAEAAIDELLAYRGTGARAARKVIDLVDTIATGGEAVVPKIDAALTAPRDGAPGHLSLDRYTRSGDQAPGVIEMDTLNAVVSRHSTATIALLEALDRIGGEAAVRILLREAEREGRTIPPMNRIVSVMFLAKQADRPEVRTFFNAQVGKFLTVQKNDWETVRVLQIAARFLDDSMWDRLSGAFRMGWAADDLEDEIAYALVQLDERRAAEGFLAMLAEVSLPVPLRQAAARAISRMPAHWDASVALVLRDPNLKIVAGYVRGLQHGRWDELRVLWRDAMESGDPEKMKAYDLERLPQVERAREIIVEFADALGPERAAQIQLPKRIAEFTEVINRTRRSYPGE